MTTKHASPSYHGVLLCQRLFAVMVPTVSWSGLFSFLFTVWKLTHALKALEGHFSIGFKVQLGCLPWAEACKD